MGQSTSKVMLSPEQEVDLIWPKLDETIKLTDFGKDLLRSCQNLKEVDKNEIAIEKIIQNSENFPLEFGTNNCRIMSQPKERYSQIQEQIASVYPVIHERVLGLYLAFLEHKKKFGNEIESKIYGDLTLTELVTRLLEKRCVLFVGPLDYYLLLTGETGTGGFEEVGTRNEKAPLTLANVLSYDEMKLSAFLSISSHTEFLNNGTRRNAGVIETDKSKITPEGVIIGLIGSRFQRENCMDWQDILITKTQNTKQNGYGSQLDDKANVKTDYRRLWTEFYEEEDFLYKSLEKIDSLRFYKCPNKEIFFDNFMMKKRFAISIDTLLLDANARAAAVDKLAYIHVVGIGLGVWRIVAHQTELFLVTFAERLKALLPRLLHVGVAHLSWFPVSEWQDLKNEGFYESENHPNGGIRTFLSNRNPAEKLSPEFEDMLVVASYAWDSNSLPGNEFWQKSLVTSSDPAAACSTLITELHNAHINKHMVNGENLHIATLEHGVMHIRDYSRMVLQEQ